MPLISSASADVNEAPLIRKTVAHEVAAILREEILRALLPPGTRLLQEEVADRFRVSTTPVREAFRMLEADGLLRRHPHKGVLVFLPSIADVREAYEIREALEMVAVGYAIEAMTATDFEELEALLEEMDRTIDRGEWISLNNEYHDRIYACAGRLRLRSMILSLRDSMAGYMHTAINNALQSGRPAQEHRAILEACRTRDVDGARAAIRLHLHHTVDMALGFLSDTAGEGLARP